MPTVTQLRREVQRLRAHVEARRPTAKSPLLDRLRADPAHLFSLAGRTPDPWQVGLLRGDSRRMLLLCSRQSGKSTTAAALALKEALLDDNRLVLLLSPTLRQSGELFRDKVLRLYADLERPWPTTQESALQVTFDNGSRIISLPGDEETIRGYSGVSLLVIDEAARVPDELYKSVRPMLAVSGGRLIALSTPFGKRGWFYNEWRGTGDWQRVRITAEQCPRIPADFLEDEKRALGEQWYEQEYQCVFTDALGQPLFPESWLDRAERLAERLDGQPRQALAIGCDPAEGGNRSTWAVADARGLIDLVSLSTPDTSVIPGQTVALMRQHKVPPDRVAFDRGGGGKQHADALRALGFPVRTVAFGEAVTPDPKRSRTTFNERVDQREERYAHVNRRAQMYGEFALLLDPALNEAGFALPAEFAELRRQLSVVPRLYDPEGRLRMPPKRRVGERTGQAEMTLEELLGCSPDEADAVVLSVHAMLHRVKRATAGAV